ncbi:hypothetical protein CsSME_00024761 [Camellia sinensis var. sinensis]
MGHKIKDMRDRLDAIAGEKNKFHLREGVVETEEVCRVERGQTDSMVNESEIYGRTNEKEMIIEMLLNNSSDRDDDVSVYAMCGMGGFGKTTLAQLVYNDGRVESYFELRIWVCVFVDFDVERLTREILESIVLFQPTCMKNMGRQPTKSSLAATNHSKGQEWSYPSQE